MTNSQFSLNEFFLANSPKPEMGVDAPSMFDEMHTTLEEKMQRAQKRYQDAVREKERLRSTYGSGRDEDIIMRLNASKEVAEASAEINALNFTDDSESGDAYTVEGPHAHITVSFNDEPVARYCIDEDGDIVLPVEELDALVNKIKKDAERDRLRAKQEGLLEGASASHKQRKAIKKSIPEWWELQASGVLDFFDDLLDVLKK